MIRGKKNQRGASEYTRVISRLIKESRLESAAGAAVRRVVQLTKDSIERLNARRQVIAGGGVPTRGLKIEDTLTLDLGLGPRSLSLVYTIIVQESPVEGITLQASADESEVEVRLRVSTPTGTLALRHMSQIQSRLYEALRHELEHATQTPETLGAVAAAAKNFMSQPGAAGHRLAYYTDPGEVPAFVSGIYYAAKKGRVPFSDLLEEIIGRIARSATTRGAAPAEVERITSRIRDAWMTYASERFPRAK